MNINELKTFWRTASYEEKIELVQELNIAVEKRGDTMFFPRHPITMRPSREYFPTENQARFHQVEWLISQCLID